MMAISAVIIPTAKITRINITIPSISSLFANLGSSFRTAKYPMIPPKMFRSNGIRYQALVGLAVVACVGCTIGCAVACMVLEAPHVGQKVPSSGSCAPHFAQYTIVLIWQLAWICLKNYHFAEDIVATLNDSNKYTAVYQHMKKDGMNLT